MKSARMSQKYDLKTLLPEPGEDQADRLTFFAFINLGFIELLANGLMSEPEAVRYFYTADNCLFVRKILKDKAADRLMSHGVQLPDLFDLLPTDKAQREFFHELATMKSLCLDLLETRRQVA
jgi:hypothetical protein